MGCHASTLRVSPEHYSSPILDGGIFEATAHQAQCAVIREMAVPEGNILLLPCGRIHLGGLHAENHLRDVLMYLHSASSHASD